jgi:hypothetical protein
MSRTSLCSLALAVALLSSAVSLGAALAHLFELPNKISLSRDDYFVVQGIYRGWSRLGIVLAIQFLSIVAVIALSRHERDVRTLSAAALVCLVVATGVVLDIHLSGECCDGQLDDHSDQLGNATKELGVFACGGRHMPTGRHELSYSGGPPASASSSLDRETPLCEEAAGVIARNFRVRSQTQFAIAASNMDGVYRDQ